MAGISNNVNSTILFFEDDEMTSNASNIWWSLDADILSRIEHFGIKVDGGGAHQSKTMMLDEISTIFSNGHGGQLDAKKLIIDDNILFKPTLSTRKITLRHLSELYGLRTQPLLTAVFAKLWSADKDSHSLLALLMAIARDPLFRDTAHVIMHTPIGGSLSSSMLTSHLESIHPRRWSQKMIRSLSRNCASSWTQSGHLFGSTKKIRQRVHPRPAVAAFAALLASVCGFGGPALLSAPWLALLDINPEQALDLLRQAETQGLARVRAAGDVIEISLKQPIAKTLGLETLVHI